MTIDCVRYLKTWIRFASLNMCRSMIGISEASVL